MVRCIFHSLNLQRTFSGASIKKFGLQHLYLFHRPTCSMCKMEPSHIQSNILTYLLIPGNFHILALLLYLAKTICFLCHLHFICYSSISTQFITHICHQQYGSILKHSMLSPQTLIQFNKTLCQLSAHQPTPSLGVSLRSFKCLCRPNVSFHTPKKKSGQNLVKHV